jgi:hypothetical protein
MKQFEYLNKTHKDIKELSEFYPVNREKRIFDSMQRGLNYLGLQGWNLVNFTYDGQYIFKREIPESPEQTQERPQNNRNDGYGR